MNSVQKSLRLNAIFSGLCGITLIILNKQIAEIFGTSNSNVFWILGVLLIYFVATLIYEISKQRLLAILWIIIQDIAWVIGSIILLISNPFEISKTGNATIAVVAFMVLFIGINQTRALAQVDNSIHKDKKQLRFERTVKASKQDVWKLISDVANYDKVAPNIDAVRIISGEGRGMVRSCSHGKDSWSETCSLWIEEKSYSFVVNTKAPDYPYKFLTSLQGTWEVQAIDSTTTKIAMYFDLQYRHKYQNWLLHPILKGKFKKTANELLDNWQKMLETKL